MPSKAFRLFVSSTFIDFTGERRLLQEKVFPALEAHCARHDFDFRAVDMRWGINDDAQLNQQTADICLGEVVEAKGYPAPNLLILVGDRYGWVPLPYAIAQDEFAALRSWLTSRRREQAVTDLDRVYQHDENHLAAEGLAGADAGLISAYTLRSREDDLVDLKPPEAWASLEDRLRPDLQEAAQALHAAGQLNETELAKYVLSLTEQEVRKGLERMRADTGSAQALAWVCTTESGEERARKLADVVDRALPNDRVLRPQFAKNSTDYDADFVDRITDSLLAAIDAQIKDLKARERLPDFAVRAERATHDAFAQERLRVFIGRSGNRSEIAAHIAGDPTYPLVLTGRSGSGKTALMARAAADTATDPDARVVKRFVGASAASANQRDLLISVVEDLAALGIAEKPDEWEEDDNRFVHQVRDLLASLDQPVTIFIDALDQLRTPYRQSWLPASLNPRVKLIVSVLDDEAFEAERSVVKGLRRNLPPEAFLAIEPLTADDGRDILAELLNNTQRELTADQKAYILDRFAETGASPLYLRMAFAIARRWRSADDPRTRGLADGVSALIGQFLEELSSVHHHEPLLVQRALGLIAAGREGLSETELIAVLSRDPDVMRTVSSAKHGAPDIKRLPDSVWGRLKRSLSAILVEKGADGEKLMTFFHRHLDEAVRSSFYEPAKATLHAALANYFEAPVANDQSGRSWSLRSFMELPFQLFHAGARERLDALLTGPHWIDHKIGTLKRTLEVVDDYVRFANPSDHLQPLIGRTLRLATGIIARDPGQAMAQIHGRLMSVAPAKFLDQLLGRVPEGALYTTHPSLTPPGQEIAKFKMCSSVSALAEMPDGCLAGGLEDGTIRLLDLETGDQIAQLKNGHGEWIYALAVLSDGRLWCAAGEAWTLLESGGFTTGGQGNTIRLWDVTRGAETLRLVGHDEQVCALAVLPDGRLASGSADKTIRLWDVATGNEIMRLEGHDERVCALAVLPDGRLASASHDETIRLWDVTTGIEISRLEGHDHSVTALAVLQDGRLASGSFDKTIRIWNVDVGSEVARLEGHDNSVCALAVLPDGCLASGSDDNTIRLWSVATSTEIAQLEGHIGEVNALSVLSCGLLASGSDDNTIRLWDPITQLSPSRKRGHRGSVNSLVILPDGRAASGASDSTIRLWDVSSGTEAMCLESNCEGVRALAVLPDGRLASGSIDDTIRIWNVRDGIEIARLGGQGDNDVVYALAALSDGRLASASDEGRELIRLWDTEAARQVAWLEGRGDSVCALMALPDGRLASGSIDGQICIWDVETGTESVRLEGHDGSVNALTVLPDGRLISISSDETIRIWDVVNESEAVRIEASVEALAILPDGRLATGSWDSNIRLWNANIGVELSRLELDTGVTALAALHNGRLIAGDAVGSLHWLAFKGIRTAAEHQSL
ncbi:NACHT domain-containing protein [Alkalicaulis satelles]|uniref:NACHT domain-containing protein n=1 Tax=Alkalicaulis satelles TaxID=2609175 RepID=A0A5M6ZMQ9_9PROT|nr:NACHT domain-containing protein [Alkalicaulis satelles]KAA5803571.1 NACHT domain-containing protein [Alkalicaulis satelles]